MVSVILVCKYHYNLFATSKNETTNSRIQSTAKKAASLLKLLYNGLLFIIHYFEKHFKPCFFILMAFKDILQHFKFVNLLFWCHEQVICQEIPRIIILTSSIFIICKDLYTISWKSQPSDFMIILFLTHVVFTIFFLFAIWICTKNSNIGNLSTEIQVQFFRETEMA